MPRLERRDVAWWQQYAPARPPWGLLAMTSTNIFFDKTVLVTGASSGLGAEFARQTARAGAKLVLVARSAGKLEQLAVELRQLSGREVVVLPFDLSVPGAGAALCVELSRRGLVIDHLINNAGVGRAKAVASDDPAILVGLLELNCVTLTELTARLLPRMVERGGGGVLQVASVVASSPSPFMAVYAASKSYVKNFTRALAYELRGTGVRVTALCPGHVHTGFQKAAGFADGAMAVPGELSAEVTVRAGLRAYERGRAVCIPGVLNNLAAFFMGLLPKGLVAHISASTLRKLGRFD